MPTVRHRELHPAPGRSEGTAQGALPKAEWELWDEGQQQQGREVPECSGSRAGPGWAQQHSQAEP